MILNKAEAQDVDEIPIPPTLYIYSLDGKIKMFNAFFRDWTKDDLLREPKLVVGYP